MEDNIVFIDKNQMGFISKTQETYLYSQYLHTYKKNREEIQKKYSWKSEGINAAFRADVNPLLSVNYNDVIQQARINGVSSIQTEEKLIYSVSIENYSGVFIKNPKDHTDTESHIIHDNKVDFLNLDYNSATGEVAISIQYSGFERNIAILDIKNSSYKILTEGDCIDDNPVWGNANPKIIYFESKGIGRDQSGNFVCYGPTVINKLNTATGDLNEILAFQNCDCFSPKLDTEDNIYFIKKPYNQPNKGTISVKEILLIPFKILKAIYNWFELFTIKHTGQPFTSNGANPTKTKQSEIKNVIINGNIINAERILKENREKGEKFPGIAPRDWELMKMDKTGNITLIKKGVIGFTITKSGEIVYSNGKYLIRIKRDGKEEVIKQVDFVDKIAIL